MKRLLRVSCCCTWLLLLLLRSVIDVGAQTETPPATVTPRPLYVTPTRYAPIDSGSVVCPDGDPLGWGLVTPSPRWLEWCGQCVENVGGGATVTPVASPWVPGGTVTPLPWVTPYGTPGSTSTPYIWPTVVGTVTPTPDLSVTPTITPTEGPSEWLVVDNACSCAEAATNPYCRMETQSGCVHVVKPGPTPYDVDGFVDPAYSYFHLCNYVRELAEYDIAVGGTIGLALNTSLGAGVIAVRTGYGYDWGSLSHYSPGGENPMCYSYSGSLSGVIHHHTSGGGGVPSTAFVWLRGAGNDLWGCAGDVAWDLWLCPFMTDVPEEVLSPTPTPAPTVTATPVLTGTVQPGSWEYCQMVRSIEDEGGLGIDLPQFRVGSSSCYGIEEQSIDLPLVDPFTFPGVQVCFDRYEFGEISIVGVDIDLDVISMAVAAGLVLRWLFRS